MEVDLASCFMHFYRLSIHIDATTCPCCCPEPNKPPFSFHWIEASPSPMEKRTFLQLLIVCLGFSYAVIAGAVPLSRGPKSENLDPSVVGMMMVGQVSGQEMRMGEEKLGNGRMDLETSNDYPGSGANNRHDPKSPGRN